MACRLTAVAFRGRDPEAVSAFWATLLDEPAVADAGEWLIPGTPVRVGLRFVAGADPSPDARRLHLHLTSRTPAHQQQTVAAALSVGAHHRDVGQRSGEGHVVLADPGGNELCVIEAGNAYLEGCGYLGEVACDGSRAVGLFWSRVLGWPLVWEQDEETAVQSPSGGTKVAWGGPPIAPKDGTNPQWFELAAEDVDAEADVLVGLGATRTGRTWDGAVELRDPDGNEFRLRPG